MIVQIKQTEVLERVVTFNTDHINYEDLKAYIETYNINLEEITPQSYFNIDYKLDDYKITDSVFYYDGENEWNKECKAYVLNRIKKAYND